MRSELFEETLKQHKDGLTDELEQLGKHRQAQLVAWDIEQNESDYEFYFNSAWSVQQSKIDELQKLRGLDEMAIKQIAHANQQWQLKCDELQKRIDKALSVTGNYCDEDDAALLIYVLEKALRGDHEA